MKAEEQCAARLLTVAQLEAAHPGFKGRLRSFILRADADIPGYSGLRAAVVRPGGGRSVYIDEVRFLEWLDRHRGAAPSPSHNPDGRGAQKKRALPPAA